MKVQTIADFDDLKNQLGAAGDKLVVVEFFEAEESVLENMNMNGCKVVFLKVSDWYGCEDMLQEYKMPTYILFRNPGAVPVYS